MLISQFDCGDDDLNEFFNTDALMYQEQLIGQTYAFTLDSEPTKIVCAFSVSNDSLRVDNIPNSRRKKVIKPIPHTKIFPAFPAVKIGRLGVDVNFRGFDIGAQLMDFIKAWFVEDANKTGCRFITVDAYNNDKAKSYYERNGFDYLFGSEQSELEHINESRNENRQLPELQTRIMYFDLIKLKTTST